MQIKEFLKPTTRKLSIDFIISLILALMALLAVPFARNIFLNQSITSKLIDIIVNTIIFMIVLYPWTCIIGEKLIIRK